MKRINLVKRLLWILVATFILVNIVACFHAYKFTHFTDRKVVMTKDSKYLSTFSKVGTLFFGVDNPRPINKFVPTQKYETLKLQSNKILECWSIKTENAKGTVILFHGYCGEKSNMLEKSDLFLKLGYNTFLVDFMGSGGSEGNHTTIGYKEAEEVKTCFDYLTQKGEQKIYLFGTSMGAVAILKAFNDYEIKPAAIILECPFGTMYQTTCARFNTMHVPAVPLAGLLDFWGGVQNNFWAFSLEPVEYAKNVRCPTLLLYGEKDEKVSRKEIDEIYYNLNCKKQLNTFPSAGHANYLKKYKQEWTADVESFLKTCGDN